MNVATFVTVAVMASEATLISTARLLEAGAARLRALHERNPAVVAYNRHRAAQVLRATTAKPGAQETPQ